MSMDPDIVYAALYGKLAGDATLLGMLPGGIHSVRPPIGTPFPWLRFSLFPSPNEEWTMGGSRISHFRFQVDVADEGDSVKAAHAALARVDVLWSDAVFTPSSGSITYCRREGYPGDTSEEVAGKSYQMAHATYLVDAQP